MKNEDTTTEDTPTEEIKPFVRSGLPREEVLALLRARLLQEGQRKLGDEYRPPILGIRTGLDAAFIVDRAKRDALIASDPKSEQLLKPFARAASIDRWGSEYPAEWIIHTIPGTVNIDDYPAIRQHLELHKDQLEKRSGDSLWFELSQAAKDDQNQVVDMKVVFRVQSDWPGFTLERNGILCCDAGFHIPNGDYYLAGLLNSKLFWFLLGGMSPAGADGVVNLQSEHFKELPFPVPDVDDKAFIGSFSDFCHRTAKERSEFQAYMCEEIAKNLKPGGTAPELSPEMNRWYILDAQSMSDESKRHFGKEIEQDKMQMWDDFLQSGKDELNWLSSEIVRVERQLDMVVYRMFGLNEEEIEYLDQI
jgi:hypothetical protein